MVSCPGEDWKLHPALCDLSFSSRPREPQTLGDPGPLPLHPAKAPDTPCCLCQHSGCQQGQAPARRVPRARGPLFVYLVSVVTTGAGTPRLARWGNVLLGTSCPCT